MAKLSALRLDKELASFGVWIPYVLDVEFLVARAGSSEFDARVRELSLQEMEGTTFKDFEALPEEVQKRIVCRAFSEYVFLGWKNLENDDGSPMEWSPEAAFDILMGEDTVDIYKLIVQSTSNSMNYRKVILAETAEN